MEINVGIFVVACWLQNGGDGKRVGYIKWHKKQNEYMSVGLPR